jgi:hypothetical protein
VAVAQSVEHVKRRFSPLARPRADEKWLSIHARGVAGSSPARHTSTLAQSTRHGRLRRSFAAAVLGRLHRRSRPYALTPSFVIVRAPLGAELGPAARGPRGVLLRDSPLARPPGRRRTVTRTITRKGASAPATSAAPTADDVDRSGGLARQSYVSDLTRGVSSVGRARDPSVLAPLPDPGP